jgi:DNA-binding Lrp family transcriptional regulator
VPTSRIESSDFGPVKNAARLSLLDKKILKALLSSTGTVSSATLSKELDIPLSTVQRRRRRLESNLLNRSYTLKAEMLGMRTAELFISTRNGTTSAVARTLLEFDAMVDSVIRVIGTNSTNIITEIRFKNNSELLGVVERIRSFSGVVSVSWIERIGFIGQNDDIWQGIIKEP